MKTWQTWLVAGALLWGLFESFKGLEVAQPDSGCNFSVYMALVPGLPNGWANCPPNWQSRRVPCELCFAFVKACGFRAGSLALWHAGWLGLTFGLIVLLAAEPIPALLGTAAGVALSHPSYLLPYYLPWDFPVMFWFTLAYFSYRRGWWVVLALAVVLGCQFKLTVLIGALFFLGGPWRWPVRVLVTGMAMLVTRGLAGTHGADFQAGNPGGFYHLWPALLANGGGLVVLAGALARRSDWPLVLVCGGFATANLLNNLGFGVYDEFRDWGELLPLGWCVAMKGKTNETESLVNKSNRV